MLDRPVWNALATGWSALAEGDARARRIRPDHGPFAACATDIGDAAQSPLGALMPATDELWLIERQPITPPPGMHVVKEAMLAQMVAQDLPPIPPATTGAAEIILLGEDDAAEMRELAWLTKPGPFRQHTNRLGRFIGIRDQGRLIAMAGERMRLPGHAEVSGLCTHPDHRGRGHAKRLMLTVAHAMRQRGETPFLHAYADHKATVALYESLGFQVRALMHMLVLSRIESASASSS